MGSFTLTLEGSLEQGCGLIKGFLWLRSPLKQTIPRCLSEEDRVGT